MKKLIAWVTALTMLLCCSPASAASLIMAGCDGSSSRIWDNCLFFSRMEEKTGTGFVFKQYTEADQWADAKAMLSAADCEWDVLFKADLTSAETIRLKDAGVIIDLKPYIASSMPNLSALLAEHPDWEKAITLPDGSIAALPSVNPLQYNNAMWINQNWLDTLGLEMPRTAEELTEVFRAFRDRDPNRNGRSDEIPLSLTGMWDLLFLSHAFGIIQNDYGMYMKPDGQIVCTWANDEMRAFLEWSNLLVDEKLINADVFATSDSMRQVTDSKADMTYGMFLAPTPLSVISTDAYSEYTMLLPLECNGQSVYRDLAGDIVRGTMAVTSRCSDVEAVLRWADYLYSEEGSILAQAGVEGIEYQAHADGTWDWIAAAEEVSDTIIPMATISDGNAAPGLVSASFQMSFDHAQTQQIVIQLAGLKQYSVLPVPTVMLTAAEQEKLTALQEQTAPDIMRRMAQFVIGERELNDEEWQAFCDLVGQSGMNEMISIFMNHI